MKMKIRFKPISSGIPLYDFITRRFRGVVRKHRRDGTWTAGTVNPSTQDVIALAERKTRRGAVEAAVRKSLEYPADRCCR